MEQEKQKSECCPRCGGDNVINLFIFFGGGMSYGDPYSPFPDDGPYHYNGDVCADCNIPVKCNCNTKVSLAPYYVDDVVKMKVGKTNVEYVECNENKYVLMECNDETQNSFKIYVSLDCPYPQRRMELCKFYGKKYFFECVDSNIKPAKK